MNLTYVALKTKVIKRQIEIYCVFNYNSFNEIAIEKQNVLYFIYVTGLISFSHTSSLHLNQI